MRRLSLPVVLCLVLTGIPSYGETVFPYKAYVTGDDVYVRSGPGQTYYPTDKLKAGQEVEVYRHDPGGWYAIRPNEGSFTWVSGQYITSGVDNLAVVNGQGVAARVGTRFSDIRDVIQVRLDKGEVVEVLGKRESGTRTWYKIAPPDGEFRWVFGKYVDPERPVGGLRKTRKSENRTDPIDSPAAARKASSGRPNEARNEPETSLPRTTYSRGADGQSPLDNTEEWDYPTTTPRAVSPEQYREQLQEIDIQVSAMLIEEPTVWEFSEMRRHAEELLADAQTAVERGQARVLLSKMDRFGDIKRRYDEINLVRRQTERSSRRRMSLRRRQDDLSPSRHRQHRFDGVGQLTRVVSPKLGAPRYVLLDGGGKVQCYVSPAPGLNLRHYIGRRVGINGTRGYMPEKSAHHIMARHVNVLDGSRL